VGDARRCERYLRSEPDLESTVSGGADRLAHRVNRASLIANVIVGYDVSVVTQILIFPVFGLHTTLAQNLKMSAVFAVVSIALLRPEAAV
jgi:hypothetical protein